MIRVVDHSDDYTRDLIASVDRGLMAASLEGAEAAAKSMPGAGAGEVGTRRGRNVYRASNPGNPPGVRTSRLKNSLANQQLGRLRWGFGTNVKYGRYLEIGTRRMASRPFLRPVLVRERVGLERAFVRASSREMARRATRG